jgi:hypothetical protein
MQVVQRVGNRAQVTTPTLLESERNKKPFQHPKSDPGISTDPMAVLDNPLALVALVVLALVILAIGR